jgi:hypothetical protein
MSGPFTIEAQLQLSPVIACYYSLLVGFAQMVGGFLSKATSNRPFYKKLPVNMGVQLGFTKNKRNLNYIYFLVVLHSAALMFLLATRLHKAKPWAA